MQFQFKERQLQVGLVEMELVDMEWRIQQGRGLAVAIVHFRSIAPLHPRSLAPRSSLPIAPL